MVILPDDPDTKPMTMEDIMKVSSKKPAYKMKKSDIIAELENVYDCKVENKILKRDLVFKLQSYRLGNKPCYSGCGCKEERNDLQEVNVMDDKTAWKHFFNMFKFWN